MDDCIFAILECLSYEDLLIASQVCKKWFKLSMDGRLWKGFYNNEYANVKSVTDKVHYERFKKCKLIHNILYGKFDVDWFYERPILDIFHVARDIFPMGLLYLTYLTDLSIGNCGPEYTIPNEISTLTNLCKFTCGYTYIKTIPSGLCNLTKLTELNFYFSPLASLPDEIGQLTNLKILCMANNGLRTLPTSMAKLTKLVDLDIVASKIEKFPEIITNLTNLTSLAIDNDNSDMLYELECFPKLSKFYASNTNLDLIPQSVKNLPNIEIYHSDGYNSERLL